MVSHGGEGVGSYHRHHHPPAARQQPDAPLNSPWAPQGHCGCISHLDRLCPVDGHRLGMAEPPRGQSTPAAISISHGIDGLAGLGGRTLASQAPKALSNNESKPLVYLDASHGPCQSQLASSSLPPPCRGPVCLLPSSPTESVAGSSVVERGPILQSLRPFWIRSHTFVDRPPLAKPSAASVDL
ncbi:hypothetical protein G7046_g4370 [Stylonectria norvegica]|nr:hypothetical protein G7046_g4370 [Stylonectria norvegica]